MFPPRQEYSPGLINLYPAPNVMNSYKILEMLTVELKS